MPLVIIVLLYMSALIIFIYRHRQRLDLAKIKDAFERKHYWDGALHAVAVLWEAHGFIWYGYEVIGFDNIPEEGAALIVYYHGAIPLDYYYLSAKCLLYKKRLIRAVGDHFLFRIPGNHYVICTIVYHGPLLLNLFNMAWLLTTKGWSKLKL